MESVDLPLSPGQSIPDKFGWLEEANHIRIFQTCVACNPQKTAISSIYGLLDYRELNARANRLAWYLKSLDIGSGIVVGVRFPRGIENVICMLAIWKTGGVYLPLDLSAPPGRVQFMVEDSRAACIITLRVLTDSLPELDSTIKVIHLDTIEFIQSRQRFATRDLPTTVTPSATAYIIYTSGTTGRPKGVSISYENCANLAKEHLHSGEITSNDRVLVFSPSCFDAGIRDILGALSTGATLFLPTDEDVMPTNLMRVIRLHKISYVVVTPSILRNCRYEDMECLKTLVLAGEAPDKTLISTWGKGRTVLNAYGPTETTVCCAKRVYKNGITDDNVPISIGRPTFGMKLYIVDSRGNRLGPEQVGEICIGGLGVSPTGYIGLPELNTQKFVENPYSHGRLFRSGDLGKMLPNGEIVCLGRSDCQIKVNGQRIEAAEVETCLRSDPAVLDAVVMQRVASTGSLLVAYVVRTELGKQRVRAELSKQLDCLLRSQLPSYSVPASINFLETLPLNASGKLCIQSLPPPGSVGYAPQSSADHASVITRQWSAEEKIVLNCFSQVLGIPAELVKNPGVTYGEMGGTSIKAQELLDALHNAFNVRNVVCLRQFYSSRQSIEDIASLMTNSSSCTGHGNSTDMFLQDLSAAIQLPFNIFPPEVDARSLPEEPGHILLTGATGFLGSHILVELVQTSSQIVYCLVRAKSLEAGYERVASALKQWQLWQDNIATRFRVILGSIDKPFLGMSPMEYEYLSRSCDTVWHCAAGVNFVAPYSHLKSVNVDGTVEVLKFSSSLGFKNLVYVSTLATFFGASDAIQRAEETSTVPFSTGIVSGYAQTKWVAEQCVMEYQKFRGGRVVVLRPGRILGSTKTALNPQQDLNVRLIRSFIDTRVAPNIDWMLDISPVDICARQAVQIANSSGFDGSIFHLVNPNSISLHRLIELINESGHGPVRLVPYNQWKAMIARSEIRRLNPLASLFVSPLRSPDVLGEGKPSEDLSAFESLLAIPCFRRNAFSIEKARMVLRDNLDTPGRLWDSKYSLERLVLKYLEKITVEQLAEAD